MSNYDADSLPGLLPVYYKYIFPYGPYCQWLHYNSQISEVHGIFNLREFSFTLQNDVYVRYQSFLNKQEFEKELMKMNPCKIDIGAIYNHPPKDRNRYHSGTFKAQTKELVFDIDMTDYDDVRSCCQGADICTKCWTLMKIAIRIIDEALRDDFGFRHILWIYSGRRGVHCWVCDDKARKLSAHARSAIVEYMSILKSGSLEKRVLLHSPVHPYIRRCINIVNDYWLKYGIEDQKLLETEESVKKLLKLVPDEQLRSQIMEASLADSKLTSRQKWEKIREACLNQYSLDKKKNAKLRFTTIEMMFEYCFPRLDVNVSIGVNHLLKSPFCVHPKTGRVCVPIDPKNVDDFDPFTVPTISELCHEIENLEKTTDDTISDENQPPTPKKRCFFRKTRLAEYMEVFDSFLKALGTDGQKESKILKSDNKKDF